MTHRCLNYALARSVWTFCLQCCSSFRLLLAYNIMKDDASMYESVCLNLLFAHASLQYVEIPVRVVDNDFLFLRNYLCRNLNIWYDKLTRTANYSVCKIMWIWKKLLSSNWPAFHAIGIWCSGVKLLFPYQKMSKLMTVLGCSLLFYVVFFSTTRKQNVFLLPSVSHLLFWATCRLLDVTPSVTWILKSHLSSYKLLFEVLHNVWDP